MYLKKLELQGFKSFPDRTTLTFERGATVVVGPNGSGKSNISDAMRWVLGEISSKNIRGSRMEDVIFGGSAKRSPMGFAEVSVTFDNGDEGANGGKIDIDYDEVTVTRRYYRVGESEYFINKTPVRLKDIHELFLNTGIGREGYSIIGQGRISEIISQKSEDRRIIFEEAAGISKYRYQKQEAQRKLSGVEDNLVRIEDIARELEVRVEPLRIESEKAKKYVELFNEKKDCDIALSVYDIDNIKKKTERLENEMTLSKEHLNAAENTLAEYEEKNNSLFEQLQKNRLSKEENSEKIISAKSLLHQALSERKLCENDIAHVNEQINTEKGKLLSTQNILSEDKERIEELKIKLSDAEKYKLSLGEKALLAVENSNILSEKEKILDEKIKKLEQEKNQYTDKINEARLSAKGISASKDAQEKRLVEIESEKAAKLDDISVCEKRIEKAKTALMGYDTKMQELSAQMEKSTADKNALVAHRDEQAKQRNDILVNIATKKHKADNLIKMENLLEGYSKAVRFVMNEYNAGKILSKTGAVTVYGPVSKVISTDAKYATAIEMALGASLQNIIVKDENDAKAAIAHLKKNNAGRATFYPIASMNGQILNENDFSLKNQTGYIGIASELVRYDAMFMPVIRSILGRTVVVDDIDNATNIAKLNKYRVRIVTLDGQIINAGGSFTGGASNHDGGGMLSRNTQIEALQKEIYADEKLLSAYDKKISALNSDINAADNKIKDVNAARNMMKTLRDAENTQLQVLQSTKTALAEGIEKLSAEYSSLFEHGNIQTKDIDELNKKISEYAAKIEEISTLLYELDIQIQRAWDDIEKAKQDNSDLLVETARAEKDVEMLTVSLSEAEKDLVALENRISESLQNINLFEIRISAAKEKILTCDKAIMESEDTLSSLESEKNAFGDAALQIEASMATIKQKIKDATTTRDLHMREFTKIEAQVNQIQGEEDRLIALLWDEYELTYSAAAAMEIEKVTEQNRSEFHKKQQQLKNKIKALGSVNVASIEEYKEVSERYNFLSGQISDLKKSGNELKTIIFDLEGQMRESFSASLADINARFGRVFRELFGGGEANLTLSNPENILESGIEINVAPPGKIIKNLSLLSGGEQSFVAIALYFALLEVNPTPFCILDEIESALDEVNVDKVANYIKNYSDKTQFVLITHRRGTMEIADRLYGVTMREKGISNIISINVNEIEQRIKEVL